MCHKELIVKKNLLCCLVCKNVQVFRLPEVLYLHQRRDATLWLHRDTGANLQPREARMRQVRSSSSTRRGSFATGEKLVIVFLTQARISFSSCVKYEFRLVFETRTNFVFVSFVSWHKNEFWFCFVCFLYIYIYLF